MYQSDMEPFEQFGKSLDGKRNRSNVVAGAVLLLLGALSLVVGAYYFIWKDPLYGLFFLAGAFAVYGGLAMAGKLATLIVGAAIVVGGVALFGFGMLTDDTRYALVPLYGALVAFAGLGIVGTVTKRYMRQ